MAWISSGPLTNPLIDTILADTGPLAGEATYGFQLLVSSTITAVVVLEHRNAANLTNVESHIFPVLTNGFIVMSFSVRLLDQERVRIRLNAGIVGSCQATLIQ